MSNETITLSLEGRRVVRGACGSMCGEAEERTVCSAHGGGWEERFRFTCAADAVRPGCECRGVCVRERRREQLN